MRSDRYLKSLNKLVNYDAWLSLLIIGVLLLIIIKSIAIALTTSFSYDGGNLVQVAQNLERNFSFASNYQTNYQSVVFDPKITTGLPFLLPIAIVFRLFGQSFSSGLMVNAFYLVMVAIAILYYLKKCIQVNNSLIFLAILMFFITPKLFEFGFGLLGEIPMFFYMMMFFIFLHKYEVNSSSRYLFWAGLFWGLGYLTKTIILICVPAVIFTILFDFLLKKRLSIRNWANTKLFIKGYLLLPAGFIIPVIAFELFKLISLKPANYIQWWKSMLVNVTQFAGVRTGFSDTPNIIEKFVIHFNNLSSYTGLGKTILAFLLITLLVSFLFILSIGIHSNLPMQGKRETVNSITSNSGLVLVMVTLSYYGWWLIITPTQIAWERYIFVAYILLEISLVFIIFLLGKYAAGIVTRTNRIPHTFMNIFIIGLFVFLFAGSISRLIQAKNYQWSFKNTSEKIAIIKAGEYIHNLPENAEIFGYYWWHAPVVGFTSGRIFKDLLTDTKMRIPGILNEKYFIEDTAAYYLDSGEYRYILNQYDYSLVYTDPDWKISIYKLNKRNISAYEVFRTAERNKVNYSMIDFSNIDNDNYYIRNVYTNTISDMGMWVQDVSGYLLKDDGGTRLKIDAWFPDLSKMDQSPVILDIYVNQAILSRYEVDVTGQQAIDVPLRNNIGNILEITLVSSARFDVQGYAHPMAFILKDIGLQK